MIRLLLVHLPQCGASARCSSVTEATEEVVVPRMEEACLFPCSMDLISQAANHMSPANLDGPVSCQGLVLFAVAHAHRLMLLLGPLLTWTSSF